MTETENRGLDFRGKGKAKERESDEVWEMVRVIQEALVKANECYGEARMRKSSAMDSGREGDVVGEMEGKFSQIEDLLKKALMLTKNCKASIGTSSAMASGRTQIRAPESDAKNLQLRFRSSLLDSYFTGNKAGGKFCPEIRVELIDKSTGRVVTSGPLSCAKLEVVAVDGNFGKEDDGDWTLEDFKCYVVTDRDGKKQLSGTLELYLKEGVGFLGDITLTDNSSWIRNKKIRLGVQVASGFCEGIRVHEAISNPFVVKDRIGEGCKKHDLPAPDDEVWRLKNIGKNGAFHKKLNGAGIFNVRDFLWKLKLSCQELRKILGSSMSNRMWETLVEHSKTCDLSGKYYVYYADNTKNGGVVFKNICELSGIIEGGEYYSAENLSDSQKVYADTLKRIAVENWKKIVDYDNLIPLDVNPRKKARSECCPFHLDQQVSPEQVLENPALAAGAPVPCQPPSVPSGEASENSKPDIEGELDPIFGILLREDILDLPSPSLDPSEQADGHTVLSIGDYDDSFEQRIQVGGSNWPRIERSIQNGGSDLPNLGWLKDLNNSEYFKMEGGTLLSERKEDEETASPDNFRKLCEIWQKSEK